VADHRFGSRARGGIEWERWEHELLPTRQYLIPTHELLGFEAVAERRRNQSRIPGFPGDRRSMEDREDAGQLYVEGRKSLASDALV